MAGKSTEREAREARERLRRYTARQSVHDNQIARRRRDNVFAVIGIVVVAALATTAQLYFFNGGPGTPVAEPTPVPTESAPPPGENIGDVPDPELAEGRIWTGNLGLNDAIDLGVELDGALAPQAVSSMVAAITDGYYVGKTCHRLVSSASAGLLQCGSLDGTGATDPTYSFGPIENAPADGIYPAGSLAMARGGDNAYSNGRQFFIVVADTTLPDDSVGGYSVIGRVTSGLDTLIAQVTSAGTADGAADGAPLIPTTITSFTIQ